MFLTKKQKKAKEQRPKKARVETKNILSEPGGWQYLLYGRVAFDQKLCHCSRVKISGQTIDSLPPLFSFFSSLYYVCWGCAFGASTFFGCKSGSEWREVVYWFSAHLKLHSRQCNLRCFVEFVGKTTPHKLLGSSSCLPANSLLLSYNFSFVFIALFGMSFDFVL